MAFEDLAWTTFANLGFEYMNKDRNFCSKILIERQLLMHFAYNQVEQY